MGCEPGKSKYLAKRNLEEIFHKDIDLITVRSVMQNNLTESDRSFRDTAIRERVNLHDVA